jgi:hypothetical protein
MDAVTNGEATPPSQERLPTQLEQKLLRKLLDASQRVRDHDRLVGALMLEMSELQEDKRVLQERLRGETEIRRIAATRGIPQREVIDAFQRWLLSEDFSALRLTWKERRQ